MVFHARPRMRWALADAKRLECGSLLPLCFYAQTTCLEPDRHGTTNNVSVPMSACAGFSTDFGTRGLQKGTTGWPRPNHGAKLRQRACHFICVFLDVRRRKAACTESIHKTAHSVPEGGNAAEPPHFIGVGRDREMRKPIWRCGTGCLAGLRWSLATLDPVRPWSSPIRGTLQGATHLCGSVRAGL